MRISEAGFVAFVIGAGLFGSGTAPALAFDGVQGPAPAPMLTLDSPRGSVAPPMPLLSQDPTARTVMPPPSVVPDSMRGVAPPPPRHTTADTTRCGTSNVRVAERPKALGALQYQAEQGHPAAQWQLGNMFAHGDGVPRDDLKAFEYFSRIADDHADEPPLSPQARIASSAFVALGCYYLTGIPNTQVRADPEEARNRFFYAASYFGDAEAQYHLARMMLDGIGGARMPQQAIKWLGLAANKGNSPAQAMLGRILFEGSITNRQGARGLMWMLLACDGATSDETWILELCDAANKQVNDDERAMAIKYIKEWLQGHRRYTGP